MGLLDSLQMGRKGLSAASAGINVVSNNVANANTVGYSRRSLTTENSDPILQQGVLFGQGVDITGIVRAHDRYLGMQLVDALGLQSRAQTAEESLKLTEAYFNEAETAGLVEVYGVYYDSFNKLSADPSDPSLRLNAVQSAERLASSVNRVADGLQENINNFDSSFSSKFSQLNGMLAQIARLNEAIGKRGDMNGNTELLDRRDELVRQVAALVGATAELDPSGQTTVYVDGHAVVSGGEARTMSLILAAGVPPVVEVSAGGGAIDVSAGIGGELGGLLDARSYTQGYLNRLDDFAFTFANSMNVIHVGGFDAYGNPGANVFTPPAALAGAASALTVDPLLAADPNLLALAGAPGLAGDDTNLQNILSFETSATFTGALTGLQFLSSITNDVGGDLAAVSADVDARDALVEDYDAMRTSISGVDPDEEAVRLIEYQAAYRAAAKIVTATDEMLRVLTTLGA